MKGGTLLVLGHRVKDQDQLCHSVYSIRPRKKICVFTVRRPTLTFGLDPKLFYGTFSRKLFKYPILALESSF